MQGMRYTFGVDTTDRNAFGDGGDPADYRWRHPDDIPCATYTSGKPFCSNRDQYVRSAEPWTPSMRKKVLALLSECKGRSQGDLARAVNIYPSQMSHILTHQETAPTGTYQRCMDTLKEWRQ